MFDKLQTRQKIHDAPKQPRTYSHPIYVRTLTGVYQVIRMFSPCFFHVFLSMGTLVCTLWHEDCDVSLDYRAYYALNIVYGNVLLD